jgi:hypothetical protein
MPLDALIQDIGSHCGISLERAGDSVTAGSINIPTLSDPDQWWRPALPDIMPRRPRGDYRERTVNLLVRDAVPNPGTLSEAALFRSGEEGHDAGAFYQDPLLVDPGFQEQLGEILYDHYVIETASGKTQFLFPFHTDLPGNFRFSGRYKMFNGLILAFFAKPGSEGEAFNTELLDNFYALFNDREELSLLDRQALRIASALAEAHDQDPARTATATALISQYDEDLADDVFLPEVHQLVQRDIRRALAMKSLGRKDRINAVLTVFYLHLALYLWRLGYTLEEQVAAFLRFLGGDRDGLRHLEAASQRSLELSPFRSQLRFRVAAARPRRVAEADPCAASFRDVNDRRLLLLPVNVSLLAASRQLLGCDNGTATFGDLAAQLAADAELRRAFDCACRIVAVSLGSKLEQQQSADLQALALSSEPGVLALRAGLLKAWRGELRRSTTDITAQLMRRGGKGLSATRGRVKYFELGQDLLLLLAKLIAGDQRVRYGEFLTQLSLYGLAPQDPAEEELLAEVLRSLQLLEKYSDTGEAMYVKHFL